VLVAFATLPFAWAEGIAGCSGGAPRVRTGLEIVREASTWPVLLAFALAPLNAILSINYTHIGGSFDPSQHHGDYNLFGIRLDQWPAEAHDLVVANPGFAGIPDAAGPAMSDPAPQAFAPSAGSPLIDSGYAGDATIVIPTVDVFGKPRDASPNIGAIE
jgi:hypothetical protein